MDFKKIKTLLTTDFSSLRNKNKASKPVKIDLKAKPKNTKSVISVDIGADKIKFVLGKFAKDKVIIEKAFMVNTPEGAVGDGNLFNTVNLSKTIENALTTAEIKIKDINCTTNSTAVINREIIVPKAAEDELETLVKYEIQQYLPINMDDYIVQHNILEEINEDNLSKYKVLVVTYPHKIAKQYYELFNNLKLKPSVLDISYNSVKKLIGGIRTINDSEYSIEEASAFIDMGADTINVNIYKNGQLDFSRIIKSGGSLIDRELSKELKISLEKSEETKRELADLNYTSPSEGSEQYIVNNIVKLVADEWIEELSRIIQFYRNKKVGNNLSKIYIHGGCANLKGIDEYLASKLNLDVEKISSLSNVEFNKAVDTNDLKRYLNAIGAIIRL
ncbi:putative cell division protein FtsA [Clostridiales bacterium oral taxon 876 str. F0540]|nr:putative cell division protein FtsA [Clostridiales bacterium oral taxon 876 str. F0540]